MILGRDELVFTQSEFGYHCLGTLRKRVMTDQHTYGHIKRSESIAEEVIERLAQEVEGDYETGQLKRVRRGPGRPPLGGAAKSVESVRLEPELRDEIARRAQSEDVTVSELIRRALRHYLKSP